MGSVPLLELRGIEKYFPGVWALKHMSFTVRPGSVHVICGENGAGKSTLVEALAALAGFDKAGGGRRAGLSHRRSFQRGRARRRGAGASVARELAACRQDGLVLQGGELLFGRA